MGDIQRQTFYERIFGEPPCVEAPEIPVVKHAVEKARKIETRNYSIDHLINNGEEIYGNNLSTALRNAFAHATEEGVVASMPYLIAGKSQAEEDNYLCENWFTALSEEDSGIDKEGLFTKKGEPVVVTVHGGGILTPDRIQRAYDEGLTSTIHGVAKFSEDEFNNLLKGTLPTGESIELYSLDEVKNGRIPNPFGRYAVVLDFEEVKATESGYNHKNTFMNNPLVIARAGTPEYLEDYFEKAKSSTEYEYVMCTHNYKGYYYRREEEGRLLILERSFGGLNSINKGLDKDGRFVSCRNSQAD